MLDHKALTGRSKTLLSRSNGFTLIELMVAMALAAVMVGMIMAVSTQAQKLFEITSSKVEVVQKVRFVIDDMRKQLETIVPTASLEFFIDKLSTGTGIRNGLYDQGEELLDKDFGPNMEGGRPKFFDEGAHIIERTYTLNKGEFTKKHHNDSIYFKAPTVINGQRRLANIEYYLANPDAIADNQLGKITGELEDNSELVLVKVVRWIEVNKSNVFDNTVTIKRKVFELCANVTDLRIEYFYDNFGDRRAGTYMSPSQEKLDRGKSEQPIRRGPSHDPYYLKEFLYGGFEDRSQSGSFKKGTRSAERSELRKPYFQIEGDMFFSELRSGDSMFLWGSNSGSRLPAGTYTIHRREAKKLFFRENIDTNRWPGDQGGIRFRAGYVPQGFRITVRVLNDDGHESRIISTIVNPRSRR